MINPEFWRGKKVLLTGHTGFKGGWLALWLQQLGAEVSGFALAPATSPNLFELARAGDGMKSNIGDLRDFQNVRETVGSMRPEIVLHLGAQPIVRESYRDPLGTYATNVMGTAHLLEAVRQTSGVRAIVVVTSDKCYQNREWLWGYREDEPMGGHDPYSNSKACAELVAQAFRDSFFAPEGKTFLASGRAGNVIGGGDWAPDRLIPDALAALAENRPVRLRNPQAVRPWQHVLEPLAGYLMLAQKLCENGQEFAQAWNFGPTETDAQPVAKVVEKLADLWNEQDPRPKPQDPSWELESGAQPHEAYLLKLDVSKARARLGWQPRWNLETALQHIVVWHRAYLNHEDLRAVTLAQIAEYQAALDAAP